MERAQSEDRESPHLRGPALRDRPEKGSARLSSTRAAAHMPRRRPRCPTGHPPIAPGACDYLGRSAASRSIPHAIIARTRRAVSALPVANAKRAGPAFSVLHV